MLAAEQIAENRYVAEQRHTVVLRGMVQLHQAADHDELAALGGHHAVRFTHLAEGEGQRIGLVVGGHGETLGGDRAHGRMDVQNDVAVLGELRRHVQGDAGEEGREIKIAGLRGRGPDQRTARHAGHEVLVVAGLDDRLLVVESGDARARQDRRLALGLQRLDVGVEARGVDRGRERAAERVADEAGDGIAGPDGDGRRGLIEQAQVVRAEALLRAGLKGAEGAAAAGGDCGPVDSGLECTRQADLDDFRLDDDLARRDLLDAVEKLLYVAKFARRRAHGDDAGLGIDHDHAAVGAADQRMQAAFEVGPEVGGGTRRDAAARDFLDAFGVLGAVRAEHRARRLAQALRPGFAALARGPLAGRVGTLPDLAGGDARARGSAALQIDVIDLKQAGLKRRRNDHESRGHAPVVVSIGFAHRVQHLDESHVLELHRDGAGDARLEHDVIGRAVGKALEESACRRVGDGDVETRFLAMRGRQAADEEQPGQQQDSWVHDHGSPPEARAAAAGVFNVFVGWVRCSSRVWPRCR